jgi:hypothetical protein
MRAVDELSLSSGLYSRDRSEKSRRLVMDVSRGKKRALAKKQQTEKASCVPQ